MIEATFMFKGDAYVVFTNGDIFKISYDYRTQVRIEKVTCIPWQG